MMTDSPPPRGEPQATGGSPDAILGGKYRIERVVGQGAFGRVFLAHDPLIRRLVAIKELLAHRERTDPATYEKYLDRFQREARAAGRLNHPNVVTVHELAVDAGDNYYLVMEYVDGTDLSDLLTQVGRLPTTRAAAVTLDVARALEAVHERDIVHRDLKPANLMITARGAAKLTDFGIAQVGNESHRTQIASGHPGTPIYMSPEQSSGNGYIDGRSDLYALGLVLYEMLVGEPYARNRRPLAIVDPTLPTELIRIVNALTEPDVARRYQHARDVVADLQPLLGLLDGSAGVYRIPGVSQTPSGQPAWQPPSPPPPGSGSVGGSPPPGDVQERIWQSPSLPQAGVPQGFVQPTAPQLAPPQPIQHPPPTPPAPVPSRYVHATRDRSGKPRYAVAYGAIFKRLGLLTLIALGVWIALVVVASSFPRDTFSHNLAIVLFGLVMFGFPVALIVIFFVLRGRTRRIVQTMNQPEQR